ncbi:hypothetical protein D3C75_617540 [compost metagenome]
MEAGLYAGLLPAPGRGTLLCAQTAKTVDRGRAGAGVGQSLPRAHLGHSGGRWLYSLQGAWLQPMPPLLPVAGSGRDLFRQPQPQRARAVAQLSGADPVTARSGRATAHPAAPKQGEQVQCRRPGALHSSRRWPSPGAGGGPGGWGCFHPDRQPDHSQQ